MSHLRTVPPQEWRTFFDAMSSALVGKRAEVEIASLDLGDQIVAEWVGLRGITYDSGDDLLDVALDSATHLIRHPREILIEEGSTGIASVAVLAADGTKEIVRLKDPVMLPAGR